MVAAGLTNFENMLTFGKPERHGQVVQAAGRGDPAPARDSFHTPFPTTTVVSPRTGAKLAGTGSVTISGEANSDCSPDPKAVATYVQRVDVQFGNGSNWSPAGLQLKDGNCRANWTIQLPIPGGLDNVSTAIRARTLSNHGGTEFMQATPAELFVTVDSSAPGVNLVVGPWTVGKSFPVSWLATDGSGISSFSLDYSLDDFTWQTWQTTGSGSATFSIGGSVPDPGRIVYFRAKATDAAGATTNVVAYALNALTRIFLPAAPR